MIRELLVSVASGVGAKVRHEWANRSSGISGHVWNMRRVAWRLYFWSEQTCSDNFGKLAHPAIMASAEMCEKRAEGARTRAEQSVYPSEQEAWLRVASEWTELARTCDHPIKSVMGAVWRISPRR
jgi:hypothetical protein